MTYNVCYACKRLKPLHTKEELAVCSARTKELTKDFVPEPKPEHTYIPDHIFERWSKVKGKRL